MPTDFSPASPPVLLGSYRIDRRLATGGMAEVFLATDLRSGRPVALKRILPHVASDPDFLGRFFHEIRIQISVRDPNIVELLDYDPQPPNACFVMEFVDGGAVQGLLAASGRFPWDLALHVTAETLAGLDAAHRAGIVHRDVKPHNVMWTRGGAIKISDFGISTAEHLTRLTVTGTVVGTPAFMSPEQARGETLDGRSDLFSAGTLLYTLLVGRNPFTSDSPAATLRKVTDLEPEPPSLLDPAIAPSVDRILRRLHAKDPAKRFPSAGEARDAIRRLLSAEGGADPGAQFVAFTRDPAAFVEARRTAFAARTARDAELLLASPAAPPEEALWAAYQTVTCAPDDARGRDLFRAAAERAGQRETPVDSPKIRELESRLRSDPDNVGLLLQLAKLHRLEHDFVGVMRFYRRLKELAPEDAYTQGQVRALLGPEASPAPWRGPRPEPARSSGPGGWRAVAGTAAALLAVLLAGAWWMRGPARRLASASPAAGPAARTAARDLAPGPLPPPRAASPAEEEIQRILERGALIEKTSGYRQAIAYYREMLPAIRSQGPRSTLLRTFADAAVRDGRDEEALAALDEAAALGGPGRAPALLRKAELLEKRSDTAGARAILEELARSGGEGGRWPASLKLALWSDRAGDAADALARYEEIVSRVPESVEANPARLGAAALYRAAGRRGDARRMYEEVRTHSAPGSDWDRSAEAGLLTLD